LLLFQMKAREVRQCYNSSLAEKNLNPRLLTNVSSSPPSCVLGHQRYRHWLNLFRRFRLPFIPPLTVGQFVSNYIGSNTILSGTITSNTPTIELGAAIGSLAGPPGEFAGALIGSMFAVGGTISYLPGTGSVHGGPVVAVGVGVNGGSGFSVSAVHQPNPFSEARSRSRRAAVHQLLALR
jgi:hypothetical protein